MTRTTAGTVASRKSEEPTGPAPVSETTIDAAPASNPVPIRGGLVLGMRLRELRKARGRTLDDLAEEIGLTKGYLSKLETGRQTPPLSTLSKLANALGADLSSLLDEKTEAGGQSPDGVSLVRANERPHVVRGGTSFGYDYQALAHNFSDKRMAPFMFTFPSQILKEVFFEHEGEEMVFVLSGTVEFQVGEDIYELSPGDCVYFDARRRHRGRGKYGEAKAIVVTYEPQHVRKG